MSRRVVIVVCPRERGVVALPVERGGPLERLDADAIAERLAPIVAGRGLGDRVTIQLGCAGGCSGPGPNVSLAFYAMPRPGERPDHVALGWRTYVGSLDALPCLAAVVDDNVAVKASRSAEETPRVRAPRASRSAGPGRRTRGGRRGPSVG